MCGGGGWGGGGGGGGADCGEGRASMPNVTVSRPELRWLAPNT